MCPTGNTDIVSESFISCLAPQLIEQKLLFEDLDDFFELPLLASLLTNLSFASIFSMAGVVGLDRSCSLGVICT